jgi:hypothetical protein
VEVAGWSESQHICASSWCVVAIGIDRTRPARAWLGPHSGFGTASYCEKRDCWGGAGGMFVGAPDLCVTHPAGEYPGANGWDTSIGMVELGKVWGGFHDAAGCVGNLSGN